jgi:hypothetical protein
MSQELTHIKNAVDKYDLEGKVVDVIAKLQQLVAEHGQDIELEIETEQEEYGDSWYTKARLFRPETDREQEERVAKTKVAHAQQRAYRKQMYDQLKKEFEE